MNLNPLSDKSPSSSSKTVPSEKRHIFTVGPDDEGRRLDVIGRKLLSGLPLSRLLKAIRQGDLRVNGRKMPPETRLVPGDQLSVWAGLVNATSVPKHLALKREDSSSLLSSWILQESQDLLVLNKPAGILVHPGDQRSSPQGSQELCLDQMVKIWWQARFTASLSFQPGPLHRLDRNTSGILVFSLSLRGARHFSQWLTQHLVQKTYFTLLYGKLPQEMTCDLPLVRQDLERRTRVVQPELEETGLKAQTQFIPLARHNGLTLAKVHLDGGRTHQIRAHAAALGYPLKGDVKYGAPPAGSWWLHAYSLVLPDDHLGWISCQAPFPPSWKAESWIRNSLPPEGI